MASTERADTGRPGITGLVIALVIGLLAVGGVVLALKLSSHPDPNQQWFNGVEQGISSAQP